MIESNKKVLQEIYKADLIVLQITLKQQLQLMKNHL